MKVTIGPSSFSALRWRSNCREISAHAVAGSVGKDRGQHSVSSREPGQQRLGSENLTCYFAT